MARRSPSTVRQAALAAGYSLSVAENTKQEIWAEPLAQVELPTAPKRVIVGSGITDIPALTSQAVTDSREARFLGTNYAADYPSVASSPRYNRTMKSVPIVLTGALLLGLVVVERREPYHIEPRQSEEPARLTYFVNSTATFTTYRLQGIVELLQSNKQFS